MSNIIYTFAIQEHIKKVDNAIVKYYQVVPTLATLIASDERWTCVERLFGKEFFNIAIQNEWVFTDKNTCLLQSLEINERLEDCCLHELGMIESIRNKNAEMAAEREQALENTK